VLDDYLILSAHLLGAAVWVGGHLVLAIGVLPRAMRERRAALVTDFESRFERAGLTALAVQVASGLWLADRLLGSPGNWFDDNPVAHAVQAKLMLLAGTVVLALHARLRVMPRLTDETLPTLGWHILAVTTMGVLFVLAGASIRFNGYPLFD
jgi:putative copper export protein